MKKLPLIVLIFLLLVISSCRSEKSKSVTVMPTATHPAPTKSPPTALPTIEPPSQDSTLATEAPSVDDPLPPPTLFDNSWNDKEIFREGLNENEMAVLNELVGASVYHLVLQIEDPTIVNGQMEIRYRNQETEALDNLFFHLFPDQLGGSITVSGVTINDQPVKTIQEATALRVPFSTPLDPNEEVVVKMNFVTTVPQEESTKYNILAYDEEILALAHFYPMLATFDEDGWHIEPTPPNGDETFADMSYYIVQVSAPDEQVIITSGVEIDHSENEDVQTVTFAAGPMRDFYLVMSDRFDVVSENIGPVQINSYAPTEFLDGAGLALDVAAQALHSYGERYGSYPYNELDIVSTPTLALGIEYPGIFANALRIYDISESSSSGTPNAITLEAVTAHETAHQWFYNLVGNDQLNEPWLDEALTQYATWTYYIDRYGEQNAQGYYDSLEGRWAQTDFAEIPIGLPADAYTGTEYGAIVYGRGPIFLNELANEMGQGTFDRFMRDYVETYRWQIATSAEFQTLAEDYCDCDLSSLFNEWVYGQ